MTLIHATCVSVDDAGVLIRGSAGAGKSDLALRLIDGGATLVADDYCEVTATGDSLTAQVPEKIAGMIEVRGYGLAKLPYIETVQIRLVVDLERQADIERLPSSSTCLVEGVSLACLKVDPSTPSAAAKVRLAIKALAEQRQATP